MAADRVTLLYIDNTTYWGMLSGQQPTSRAFLARMILSLVTPPAHAAVIGLDFQLLAPEGYEDGTDSATRAADNQKLLEAIQYAGEQKVPVILGGVYIEQEDGKRRLPTLFRDEDLRLGALIACPRCAQYGYIDAPQDKRLIPGIEEVRDPTGKQVALKPFSVAITDAYVGEDNQPGESARVSERKHEAESLFGTFHEEGYFRSLTALEFVNDPSLREKCDNRIVLIGGHWKDLQGYGDTVDMHLSPAGTISGLGLHANYVESLLDQQYAREVPLWVDIAIDILLGMVIYTLFALAHGWRIAAVLAFAFTIPFACAYIALVSANLYLDFLFPIELYFLHILYELLEDYVHAKRHGDDRAPAKGAAAA
jgi:CHASE2 domain-containing sensor protein